MPSPCMRMTDQWLETYRYALTQYFVPLQWKAALYGNLEISVCFPVKYTRSFLLKKQK